MYVCICKGITDTHIKEMVVEQGVGSIRELKQQIDIASQCGTCVKLTQKIIDDIIVDESLYKEVS